MNTDVDYARLKNEIWLLKAKIDRMCVNTDEKEPHEALADKIESLKGDTDGTREKL